MKRSEVAKELEALKGSFSVNLSKLIQSGKIKRDFAVKRLNRIKCALAIIENITDKEFEEILGRIEIKGDDNVTQGSLF